MTKLLQSLMETVNLSRLNGMSEVDVKDAFFSNYLAGLVILKFQDLKGLSLINDPSHVNLTSFSQSMNEINFWGRAMFHPTDKEVAHRMLHGHAQLLQKQSGRVLLPRVRAVMKVMLTPPAHVNWDEVVASLVLLRARFEVTSTYFRNILYRLHRWTSLNVADQKKIVNDAYMYLLQSDPHSSLLPRLRALSTSTLIKMVDVAAKVTGYTKLKEDGDSGGAGGAVAVGTSAGNIGSTDNAIVGGSCVQQNMDLGGLYRLKKKAPYQVTKKSKYKFRDNKIIKKRAKKFAFKKFETPDSLKPQKSGEENV